MLLKNILNSLIKNQLGNLSIGKPEWANDTSRFNYTQLIDCVSQAYLELHKRFMLQKEFVRIVPVLLRTNYPLELQYAVSDNTVGDKFIIDTVGSPFPTNIVKIDTILGIDGKPIQFNTTTFDDLVRITKPTELYIPDPAIVPELTLVCRALPEPIVLAQESDLDTYDLDLHPQYLEALYCYAAGTAYINRGAENATNNESAIFFARFEAAVMNIDQLGLHDREEMPNDRLSQRGFV